jgi:hypothetical protein
MEFCLFAFNPYRRPIKAKGLFLGSIEEFVGKFRWEEGKEQEEGV